VTKGHAPKPSATTNATQTDALLTQCQSLLEPKAHQPALEQWGRVGVVRCYCATPSFTSRHYQRRPQGKWSTPRTDYSTTCKGLDNLFAPRTVIYLATSTGYRPSGPACAGPDAISAQQPPSPSLCFGCMRGCVALMRCHVPQAPAL
jgi:hypothetical protein